jgi:hypothetical protein
MYNLYTSTYFHTRTKSIYEEFLIVREFSDHVVKFSDYIFEPRDQTFKARD